ncbi:MAG TPA: ATP-binding protein [Bacteroidetes bacterium]|nr:ATP-binding protein [Bacteroidota bacterium]
MMQRKINISSIPSNLRLVEMMVDEISNEQDFNSDMYGKILIATVEAVNNAIIHGNRSNPEKFVEVEFKKNNGELEIIVEDEGEGFDYESIPDPTAPENIENIHGRGVFLIRQLSDEVVFNKKGKQIVMVFKI